MKIFRNLSIAIEDESKIDAVFQKVLELWHKPPTRDAVEHLLKKEQEIYEWHPRYYRNTIYIMMEKEWETSVNTFPICPRWYREINLRYKPSSAYNAPRIQEDWAKNRNNEQKVCFATDEMAIAYWRADVLEVRWDHSILEYEVKVTKQDFDSELQAIKSVLAKGDESGSKYDKHKAYLSITEWKRVWKYLVPDYFYFIVTPELAEYCGKSLKWTPYWMYVVEVTESDWWKVWHRFFLEKTARKLPWAWELEKSAIWWLVMAFGNRARTGRNLITENA